MENQLILQVLTLIKLFDLTSFEVCSLMILLGSIFGKITNNYYNFATSCIRNQEKASFH